MISPGKPLTGKRILITRSESQALPVVERIEHLGGTAVCVPLLTFRLPSDRTSFEQAMGKFDSYKWIIFTSQNAVRYFLSMSQLDSKNLQNHKIAAIGEKTEKLLDEQGVTVDFTPSEYVAETFVEQFSSVIKDNEKALLPHGNLARDVIPDGLLQHGKRVDSVVVYETLANTGEKQKLTRLIQQNDIDIVTFTSSSTVDFFFTMIGNEVSDLSRIQFACIGPITARTLGEVYGYKNAIVADTYTMEGLLDSIVKKVREEEK